MFKKFVNILGRILGKKYAFIFLEKYIDQLKEINDTFVTYYKRPIKLQLSGNRQNNNNVNFKLAIVIQGPIILSNSFTYETIKLYRYKYPSAIIILSTWEEYRFEFEKWLDLKNVIAVFNKKPELCGPSNFNLQLLSTKNGILKAQECGADYLIKTRTDQRFYASNIDQYLVNLLNLFPVNNKFQKGRIVGLSLNTFKYRMYGLSDMFTFGHLDDMLLYWNIPFDNRIFDSGDLIKFNKTLRNYSNWRICEVYLMTEFLKKTNHNLMWTIKDSWGAFASQFCVIDRGSIDLYWGKYSSLEDMWITYDDQVNKYEEMSFKDWLNLYCNYSKIEFPEYLLDEPLKYN